MTESSFHDQLLLFLQEDFVQKKNDGGWDEIFDPELRTYCDTLSRSIRSSAPMPLHEIIEKYQHLFIDRGPIHLEQKILGAFPEKEMSHLGFNSVKIYRGLPRFYRRSSPTFTKIKPHFAYLPSLKRTVAAKAVYSLYQFQQDVADARLTIFTWVMPDGLGDYFASVEVARLIKASFPSLNLNLFVISDIAVCDDLNVQRWVGSELQLDLLRSSDLILEMPTVHPTSKLIQQEIKNLPSHSPLPIWETVGQYGFVDSDQFHPQSKAYCMGLHFLEQGILLRKSMVSISDLENKTLSEWLFQKDLFTQEDLGVYKKGHRFFLAYLLSCPGTFVYLHAVLKSLEHDAKDIDICFPDAARLIQYIEKRQNKPIEKSWGLSRMIIQIDQHLAVWNFSNQGKTLRLLCPGLLSPLDFQRLLVMSEPFVACRGDQSFSDIISQNKGFFYDPRDHSRYFVKDLIAIAENRIPQHRATLTILHLYNKLLEHNLPVMEGEWVDDIAIQRQEPMDLLMMAESMGQCLQDPDAFVGFKKLGRILAQEYSCNDFFIHMIQRTICHRRHPEIARLEEEELTRFTHGLQSFSCLIERLRSALKSFK